MSSPENGCDPRALARTGSAPGVWISGMLVGVCIIEEGATVAGVVVVTAGGLTSGAAETLMGDGAPKRCVFDSLKARGSYPAPWFGNEAAWPLTLCLIDWISWTSSSSLLYAI